MAAPRSERPEEVGAPPARRRRRRSARQLLPLLGTAAFGVLLVVTLWRQPEGDQITLHSGERLQGRIVAAEPGRLVVETGDGEQRRLPPMAIAEVALAAPDGTQRRGSFIDWQDGVYRIRAGGQEILLRDGLPIERPRRAQAAANAPAADPDALGGPMIPMLDLAPMDEAPRPAPAAASPRPAPEPSRPLVVAQADQLAATGDAATEAAPAPAGERPLIEVQVTRAAEADGEAVFDLTLSSAPAKPLIVIYASVDGDAEAGADFERLSGVLTIPAGATEARLRTLVTDDDEIEGDETFKLFLTIDPGLARLAGSHIEVTITDND